MSAVFTPIGEQVKQDLQDTGPPLKDKGFRWMLFAALSVGIITLAALLIFVFLEGYPRLTPTLWQNMPSIRFPEKAGAQSAIMGSIWVIVTTAFICLPVGVMAAIYLEEYGNPNRRFDRIVEINIQNLAAVPSIVYGILGLGVIARALALGQTVITAATAKTAITTISSTFIRPPPLPAHARPGRASRRPARCGAPTAARVRAASRHPRRCALR